MSTAMKLAMSIPTITLIAIPIATGLARNMLILIATSMVTTTAMSTNMITSMVTTTSMITAMNTVMARITTTMA